MRNFLLRALIVAPTIAVAILVTSGIHFLYGQEHSAYEPELLPDGQPNIQGVYISPAYLALEHWSDEEREKWGEKMLAVRGPSPGAYGTEWTEGNLREGSGRGEGYAVVEPQNGRVPWQPWALTKKTYIRDNPYERKSFIDTRVRCLPAGTPRGTFSSSYNGWQVLQTPGHVIILYEHNHLYRVIPIDGSPHPGKDIQLWMGDSRGRWEGNTLVVDVRNLTDKTWVIGELGGEGMSAGSFHSPELHVVERFTIVDGETVDYEATIEDPNVFTQPWKIAYRVWQRAPPEYVLFEYACHEGNRSMDLTAPLISNTP